MSETKATASKTDSTERKVARFVLASLPPLATVIIQWLIWPLIDPYAWFLFVPAVFISSWIGGLSAGLGATLFSTVVIWWFFVPPQHTFAKNNAGYLLAAGTFFAMGVVFSIFHRHFRRANQRVAEALADAQKANEALRLSNIENTRTADARQLFAALIDNSSDFIGIADPSGKPVYVNPAGRRMVGLPPDYPIENTQIPDYYPPRERAFAADVILRSMKEHGHWAGETYFRNFQTEQSIPVSDTHFMIRDASGERILGMGTVTRDISEARKEREQLREAEERFRLAIDGAPIGMALVALDGRFVRVNRVLCELVGYTAAELTGLTFQRITQPDDLDADLDLLAKLTRGEIPSYQLEKRYIRKDGTTVDVNLSASILRDKDGGPAYYVAQIEDITERKQLASLLRESHADLHRAQLVAKVGSWRLDVRRDALDWSDETYRIFGIAPGSPMTYDSFLACVHPDDRAHVHKAWNAALRGEPYDVEHRVLVNGAVRWVREKADLRLDEQGAVLGGVGITQDITEAKHAEEALRRSEQDFRSLAESMPQIVWATDTDGLNTYFNRQWVDYTGLSLSESYGEGWIKPFHPDDRQRAWDAWARATKYRDSYSLECRLRRSDGEYQWWLIRGVPLLNANGEITKWFGTCTDIEQMKIAEQTIKDSEAKFSGIVTISADAIISIDDEQRIIIFNDGAEKIFGYSKAEAIGTPLERLLPARFREAHRRHIESFAAGQATARAMGERVTTIAGLRKSGEEFPAEAAISKLEIGGKTLLTVALRDTTERKRTEKEKEFLAEAGAVLAASLDYEQTLATVAQLVVREFADWCLVEVVDEHEQLRRLKVASADPSKAELCTALERMPIDRSRPYLLRSVVQTKEILVIDDVTAAQLESVSQGPEHLQALRAVSPVSLMALPLLTYGKLVGALVFISSTPTRRYHQRDVDLAKELAKRAAIAIENARLYRASVQATQIRDQVLGFVAHDLRNPLAAIQTQAQLLLRGEHEPARSSRKPAEAIERATVRMARLIQDILDVSRMEAGHLTVEPSFVSAAQIVADSVEAQRSLASSASLDIRIEVADDVSVVWADRDRLLQVFENLIGNATKFTPREGRITCGACDRDGEILFWVADTGTGIAPEDIPHVFDRFWQAQKAKRAGAGLGLQIVQGIIEAHGGRVWLASKVGIGTTVYFTIPAAPTAGSQPAAPPMH